MGGDPHALELGANREPAVQGEPNEGVDFAEMGVVPILASTWGFVELLKLNCWMKEQIIGTLGDLFEFLYPRLAKHPKKGESPRGGILANAIPLDPRGGLQ